MKKINAFVYRDEEHLYVVPLIDEKKIEINDAIYLKCDDDEPLKEESLALCWYEPPKNTNPAVIVDLYFNSKLIKANRLKFDNLVDCAYEAAIKYTKAKKA